MKKQKEIFKHNLTIYNKFIELEAYNSARLIVENMIFYAQSMHIERELFFWTGLQYEVNQLIARSKSKFPNGIWQEKIAAQKADSPIPHLIASGCRRRTPGY